MPGKKWTIEEENYLKTNFIAKTCEQIAKKIGKTTRAVQHKFGNLGLERPQPQVGDKINKLIIRSKQLKQHYHQQATYVTVECDCGKIFEVPLKHILSENTTSCGCYRSKIQRERAIKRNFKHGKADTKNNRLFRTWCGMKSRCYTKSNISYKNYGGRGVKVCEEWRNNYLIFEKWALENGYTDNLTIDRKRVNEDYYPDNCCWKTIEDQQLNKRTTVLITAFGETQTLSQWNRDPRAKIDGRMIKYRIDNGWSEEKAISTPPLKHNRWAGEPKSPA